MIISLVCRKHGYQQGDHCSKCEQDDKIENVRRLSPDFVDVNTTGKPIHFTSWKAWDKHCKNLGLNCPEQKPRYKLGELPKEPKFNREKFKNEIRPIVKEYLQDTRR